MAKRNNAFGVFGATLLFALGMLAGWSAAMAQVASPHQFINVLSGNTGGVYYTLGGALSNIYSAKIPGVRASSQATRGSADNLNILQQGRGEIAFTQGDSLVLAWAGDAGSGFKGKLDKLRGIAAIYPNYIQIVATKESSIKTFAELKGKRVSVGAARSGMVLNAQALAKAAGLSFKDFAKAENMTFEDAVDLLKNKQLDAAFVAGGLGFPALVDISNTFSVVFVEIPGGIVNKAGSPYVKTFIPKGTYKGQDADVQTAGLPNYFVTRADLSADLVYNMTKVIFDSTAELIAAHPAASGIKLERAVETMPIPLHPGAQKYYKEKGLVK
jgi:TRAP transporter TAXI family solute receptor